MRRRQVLRQAVDAPTRDRATRANVLALEALQQIPEPEELAVYDKGTQLKAEYYADKPGATAILLWSRLNEAGLKEQAIQILSSLIANKV